MSIVAIICMLWLTCSRTLGNGSSLVEMDSSLSQYRPNHTKLTIAKTESENMHAVCQSDDAYYVHTSWTILSISSAVTPGFMLAAAMSNTSRPNFTKIKEYNSIDKSKFH